VFQFLGLMIRVELTRTLSSSVWQLLLYLLVYDMYTRVKFKDTCQCQRYQSFRICQTGITYMMMIFTENYDILN